MSTQTISFTCSGGTETTTIATSVAIDFEIYTGEIHAELEGYMKQALRFCKAKTATVHLPFDVQLLAVKQRGGGFQYTKQTDTYESVTYNDGYTAIARNL